MNINKSDVCRNLSIIIGESSGGSSVFFAKLCSPREPEQIPALLIAMNALANRTKELVEITEKQKGEISVLKNENDSFKQLAGELMEENSELRQEIKNLKAQYTCFKKIFEKEFPPY